MAKSTKSTKSTTKPAAPAFTLVVPGAGAWGRGRVGVVDAIREMLESATPAKPVTKAQILDGLCERFPDRARDKMRTTVNVQVSTTRLGAEMARKGKVLGSVSMAGGATGFFVADAADLGDEGRKALAAYAAKAAERAAATAPITPAPIVASKPAKAPKAKAPKAKASKAKASKANKAK